MSVVSATRPHLRVATSSARLERDVHYRLTVWSDHGTERDPPRCPSLRGPPEGGRSDTCSCSLRVCDSRIQEVAPSTDFCYLGCKCSHGERGGRRLRYEAPCQGPLHCGRHGADVFFYA